MYIKSSTIKGNKKVKAAISILIILSIVMSFSISALACDDCQYGFKWIENACHDNVADSLWAPDYGGTLLYVYYSWDNSNYHPSMDYSEWCSGSHYWAGTLYKDYVDTYGPYFMGYEDWDRDDIIDNCWYQETAYGYYDGYIWLQY